MSPLPGARPAAAHPDQRTRAAFLVPGPQFPGTGPPWSPVRPWSMVPGGSRTATRMDPRSGDPDGTKHEAPGTNDLESDPAVFGRGDVNTVDETDLVRLVLHDHGAGAVAVAEEAHPLHQRPVRDAGRSEN